MMLLEHQLKRFDTDLESLFEARCDQGILEGLDFDSPDSCVRRAASTSSN